MYLHTRLLLGILAVTLFALLVTVLVPLASLRQDVARETGASLQLAGLLLDIEAAARNSATLQQAQTAVAQEVLQARHLRHVGVAFVDATGKQLAATPTDERSASWLARVLLPQGSERVLTYPLAFQAEKLGALRVRSNPLSEFE